MCLCVCKNETCNKQYDDSDKNSDPDFCSFECWEKVNCHEPQHMIFEQITLTE